MVIEQKKTFVPRRTKAKKNVYSTRSKDLNTNLTQT